MSWWRLCQESGTQEEGVRYGVYDVYGVYGVYVLVDPNEEGRLRVLKYWSRDKPATRVSLLTCILT